MYDLPKWIKFSVKKNKTLKKYWKNGKKYWKSQGKVREFCQSEKVGTLFYFYFVLFYFIFLFFLKFYFCIF